MNLIASQFLQARSLEISLLVPKKLVLLLCFGGGGSLPFFTFCNFINYLEF